MTQFIRHESDYDIFHYRPYHVKAGLCVLEAFLAFLVQGLAGHKCLTESSAIMRAYVSLQNWGLDGFRAFYHNHIHQADHLSLAFGTDQIHKIKCFPRE